MKFRVYLIDNGGNRFDETTTPSPPAAEAAYREMLQRIDTIGDSVHAVLERDGEELYSSNCAAVLGSGRIHPLAPLDLYGAAGDTRALAWLPMVA